MKKMFLLGILFSLFQHSLFSQIATLADPEQDSALSITRQLLYEISRHEYSKADARFGPVMKQVLPEDKLKDFTEKLEQQVGKFQMIQKQLSEKKAQSYSVQTKVIYEKTPLIVNTTVDSKHRVTGLYFTPKTEFSSYSLPSYADTNKYKVKDFSLDRTGAYMTPASLFIPKNATSFPILVLMSGSGANDRYETIGPNKVFYDLAAGLATKGIGVLVYDKRTYAAPNPADSCLNLNDEYFQDATAALHYLNTYPKASKVFLGGHSEGAYLTPIVAKMDKQMPLAGLIMLAAPARGFYSILKDQYVYTQSLDPNKEKNDAAWKAEFAKLELIKNPKKAKKYQPYQLPAHWCGSYFAELDKANPLKILKKIKYPVLIIQGGRDYQVSMEDYELFNTTFAAKPNFTFSAFPDLNHLLMKGEGKSKPTEYGQESHVSQELVESLASWILKH